MKLAVIIAPILLLLSPLTTYAASAQGRRDFIINEPFEKVLDALSDPDGLKKMLKEWNAEIVTFQWEELDAGLEKVLFKDGKVHWDAQLKFKTHIRARTPRLGLLNIHARVTVYRTGDSAVAQFQLLQPVAMVSNAWAKVEIIRQGNKTLLRARLYARAHPPYFRCCLVRRIANRIAQKEVCKRVGNLLWTFEQKVRIIVASYRPPEKEFLNEKMDLNSPASLRGLYEANPSLP